MADMLKTRNFVIRHNFFVPTGSSKLPTQNIENEILELSDWTKPTVLRSGRTFYQNVKK